MKLGYKQKKALEVYLNCYWDNSTEKEQNDLSNGNVNWLDLLGEECLADAVEEYNDALWPDTERKLMFSEEYLERLVKMISNHPETYGEADDIAKKFFSLKNEENTLKERLSKISQAADKLFD